MIKEQLVLSIKKNKNLTEKTVMDSIKDIMKLPDVMKASHIAAMKKPSSRNLIKKGEIKK